MKDRVSQTMFSAFCSVINKRNHQTGFRAVQNYVNTYLEKHELNEEQQQTLNKLLEKIKP